MQSKLAWLGFGASIMLNLVFIAGVAFGWSHHLGGGGYRGHHGWGDKGGQSMVERLSLNDAQTAGLEALRDSLRERRKAVWGEGGSRQAMRQAMLAELQKPTFDPEQAMTVVAEASQDRHAFFVEMAGELHGYLQTLSPEQRATFFELAAERGFLRSLLGRRGRGHHRG